MSVILIVEDELLEQEFLQSLAEGELQPGDRVLTCESGVQAVKLAQQHRPDLIFMDILIPEMDGLKALTEIRQFLPESKVVILSACSDFSYAQTAIRLKVEEYLLKPIKPAVFKQILRRLLTAGTGLAGGATEALPADLSDQTDFIEKSLRYIHDNFKQKLPLQLVSSYVFVNPQYFSRIFKKEVGMNYIDYVNALKIEYACKLLETTNYPAYRISGECGFTDPSYFNRVFVQQMEMTPKAYRRKHLNDSAQGS